MVYIPPGGGDVRPPLGKPNAEILPQTFESGNHEPNCHGSKNGRNCFFRKKRTHVSCHYTQRPGPSSQTGVEVVCNAFTTKVQNWTFYERFSTPDLLCGQRRPLQNPSPAFGRDKRGPPVSSQNRKDSPVFGRAALVAAERGVGGRAGTRPSRISANPQPSLRPRQARPSRIFAKPQRFAGFRERGPPVSSQNRKDSSVFGRAALVAAGRGVGG